MPASVPVAKEVTWQSLESRGWKHTAPSAGGAGDAYLLHVNLMAHGDTSTRWVKR